MKVWWECYFGERRFLKALELHQRALGRLSLSDSVMSTLYQATTRIFQMCKMTNHPILSKTEGLPGTYSGLS